MRADLVNAATNSSLEGILTIRPLSEKGLQFVQNDTMVFYISRGKVSVTIHHTTSILQNGDMFFVPQGQANDLPSIYFALHSGQ